MNTFIDQYIKQLKGIDTDEDVRKLYRWFWDQRENYVQATELINTELGLKGSFKLQPDLPCLTVGGTKGVLLVSANPGWKEDLSPKEETFCRTSPEHYIQMMEHFFFKFPAVVGERSKWWTKALASIDLLNDPEISFTKVPGIERWKTADKTGSIGGWELLPFHSSKDGITPKIEKYEWLKECALESLRAALRLKPKVLFAASKDGTKLMHEVVPELNEVQEVTLGKKKSTSGQLKRTL